MTSHVCHYTVPSIWDRKQCERVHMRMIVRKSGVFNCFRFQTERTYKSSPISILKPTKNLLMTSLFHSVLMFLNFKHCNIDFYLHLYKKFYLLQIWKCNRPIYYNILDAYNHTDKHTFDVGVSVTIEKLSMVWLTIIYIFTFHHRPGIGIWFCPFCCWNSRSTGLRGKEVCRRFGSPFVEQREWASFGAVSGPKPLAIQRRNAASLMGTLVEGALIVDWTGSLQT